MIPEARHEEVEGCGYYGCPERPVEVNALILTFFATPGEGPGPAQPRWAI